MAFQIQSLTDKVKSILSGAVKQAPDTLKDIGNYVVNKPMQNAQQAAQRQKIVINKVKPYAQNAATGIKLLADDKTREDFATGLMQPDIGENKYTTGARRTLGNIAIGQTSGLKDLYSAGEYTIAGERKKALLTGIRGISKIVSTASPLNIGANLLSSYAPDTKIGRVGAGITKGMSLDDLVAAHVKGEKIILPVVGEIDPLMAIGEMIGFTQAPQNKTLFKLTNMAIPTAQKTLAAWLATTPIRGAIEDIIIDYPDMPDNLSMTEKAVYISKSSLRGAASEVVGQGFFKIVGKGKQGLTETKIMANLFDELKLFRAEANKLTLDPKTGNAVPQYKVWLQDKKLMQGGAFDPKADVGIGKESRITGVKEALNTILGETKEQQKIRSFTLKGGIEPTYGKTYKTEGQARKGLAMKNEAIGRADAYGPAPVELKPHVRTKEGNVALMKMINSTNSYAEFVSVVNKARKGGIGEMQRYAQDAGFENVSSMYKSMKGKLTKIENKLGASRSEAGSTKADLSSDIGGGAVGSLAGFEKDENGKWRYNPAKGAFGVAVGVGASRQLTGRLAKLGLGTEDISKKYQRGDIGKLEKELDILAGTDSFQVNNKWTSKLKARNTALDYLEDSAKTDPGAAKAMRRATEIIDKLEEIRGITTKQPTMKVKGGKGVSQTKTLKATQPKTKRLSVKRRSSGPTLKVAKSGSYDKSIPKTFDDAYSKYIADRDIAQVKATQRAKVLTNIPTSKAKEVIDYREGVTTKATSDVKAWAKQMEDVYKDLHKEVSAKARRVGLKVGELENYVPHYWKESQEKVQQAFLSASKKPGQIKGRVIPTYKRHGEVWSRD